MTTFPITQVGWARACSGVTDSSCFFDQLLNGPPDAVKISLATSSFFPPSRHWAKAECSLSTGIICPAPAAWVTSRPPTIRDSLLASARVLPVRSVARVGAKPMDPVMPLMTTSASVFSTNLVASAAPSTALATLNCAFCVSKSSVFLPAARPTNSNRSGFAAITSRAWVPMEPVEPRMITRRINLSCHH